jgi:serine/threonine-protein kinase
VKLEKNAKYISEPDRVLQKLGDAFRVNSMEIVAPNPSSIVHSFLDGNFFFRKHAEIYVECMKAFLELFRRSSDERRRIILSNLHSKLDALPRYAEAFDNDIPF